VARGAGLAGLARLGALIEALAQPLFTWLFGLATYGLYVVLWGAINLLSNLLDLSMTAALQRIVPGAADEAERHGAVKFAFLAALLPSSLAAIAIAAFADPIAAQLAAAPEDRASLPFAIRLFAPALPLWVFIEISTAAARARRAFGPEIRLRIFWEQLARIGFALGFFGLGLRSTGLVAAHLCSLTLTAMLCVPLLRRYYDLSLLIRAPISAPLARKLLATGAALLPASLTRRLLIDAPPVVLNLMLSGTRGAVAAGLFEIARKISTVPLIVRQAFAYVMAPLTSAQARADRASIAPLYRFAARVSTALVVPLAGLLIFAGADILSLYSPEAAAALPILTLLVAARAADAIVGPATSIVETIGHRLLPLVNSLLAVAIWVALTLALVPSSGAMGMAVAVAAATLAGAYAATLELKISDGLSPFDRRLFAGLSIGIAGIALMAAAEAVTSGPARFVTVLLLWAATSWLTLRHGLARGDREALGGLSGKLKLV
jgi:O-antigen/teichoic acid export membrane protein